LELKPMVFRPFIAPRFDFAAQRESELVDLPRGHLPALDAVRGLAILAVTLYRFGGGAGGAASAIDHSWIVELGSRGVDLFFVLSGFLITGILFDSKGKRHFFRDFYGRRALRIFPLYYAMLFVTLVLLPAVGGSMAAEFRIAADAQGWLWLYAANLLQGWRGEWCLGPLNHFWSLSIEEHFYLIWPVVIYYSSRRTALGICGGVLVFSVLSRAVWLAAGGNDVAAEVFTPLRMDGLVLGGWLALVARGSGGLGWAKRFAPAALVLFGSIALSASIFERRLFGLSMLLWACASGAVLILVLTARPKSVLGWIGTSRPLQFLGKYSYGIYVFQLPLITILANVLTAPGLAEFTGGCVVAQAIYCAVMFAATITVAVLSWQVFESRWLALKRHFA
jgi:peptidoglycan/LPS O-acetylase OafA/YrhL